ncbi:MAG: MerR family DNA-binding transcriptional regulator [Patescibacteria group bacterium]
MPKKYLTVNEVAKIVGVTPLTVRNWDKKGQLVAYRHPVNNYRLYKTEDVESLMNQIEKPLELTEPKLRKLKVEAF